MLDRCLVAGGCGVLFRDEVWIYTLKSNSKTFSGDFRTLKSQSKRGGVPSM